MGWWVLRLVEGCQKRLQCKCQLLSHPAQPVRGRRLAQRLSQLPTYLLPPMLLPLLAGALRCAAQRAPDCRPKLCRPPAWSQTWCCGTTCWTAR